MIVATITGGAIAGYVALVVILLGCVAAIIAGTRMSYDGGSFVIGGIVVGVITIGVWWWGMAFTLSGDYHAWNVKQGQVTQISKRLVPAGDKSMMERYVLVVDGQPLGVDDTRAALVKTGQTVSLRCKKDYQWGIPREAHGWACRWNGVPS